MHRFIAGFLVFSLVFHLPVLLKADVEGGCVSQYCACDGQMHECGFSEAQCAALCGGGSPSSESSSYHDSGMDVLLISFLVSFAVIGLVLWASGSLNFDVGASNGMPDPAGLGLSYSF